MMIDPNCEMCKGTGWYGDNGPGIRGNTEYGRCECVEKTNPAPLNPTDAELIARARDERLKNKNQCALMLADRLERANTRISTAIEALEKAKGNASTSGVEFIETELAKIRKMGGSND